MLTFVTYAWGNKYSNEHIIRLKNGIARNMKAVHRFAVVSDDGRRIDDAEVWRIPPEDLHLTRIPGCLARLRLFDPAYLEKYNADRIVVMDLDSVIISNLDPLFEPDEPFLIFQGANVSNKCPYNGSTWLLQRGYRPDVWEDFTLKAASKVPFFKFPEDQAWIAYKIHNAKGWKSGTHGMYAFKKPGWPRNDKLPADARIVTFVASKDPEQYVHFDWVREHWLAEHSILHPEYSI